MSACHCLSSVLVSSGLTSISFALQSSTPTPRIMALSHLWPPETLGGLLPQMGRGRGERGALFIEPLSYQALDCIVKQ